ncbi:MAG TPA: hypothetical protein VFB78_03990 [Acidimicrobiales bacterium]|nr:hypothetical protein [Acidimicrobiales bacterium]
MNVNYPGVGNQTDCDCMVIGPLLAGNLISPSHYIGASTWAWYLANAQEVDYKKDQPVARIGKTSGLFTPGKITNPFYSRYLNGVFYYGQIRTDLDVCVGDSGGALLGSTPNGWVVLMGVTVYGENPYASSCAANPTATAYTDSVYSRSTLVPTRVGVTPILH